MRSRDDRGGHPIADGRPAAGLGVASLADGNTVVGRSCARPGGHERRAHPRDVPAPPAVASAPASTGLTGEATFACQLATKCARVSGMAEAPVIPAIISADSHITEPAGTYVDHIDAGLARSGAPPRRRRRGRRRRVRRRRDAQAGADGARGRGGQAARGDPHPRHQVRGPAPRWLGSRRAAWTSSVRDGVAAEVIYPTVGMVLCNHRDFDFKHACFEAYNRWIASYCDVHPDRLLGCGQTAMRTPEEGIADLHDIKALGLRGVMMPGVARRRGLRLPGLRRVLGGRRSRPSCRSASTSSRPGPSERAARR